MPSRLERIPLDVLTHVALYTVDPEPTAPLDALLQLLLSSRHLHRLLALESCPQLYARIFREKFDLDAHARRGHYTRTTSCLASELRTRRCVLRRIRLSQVLGGYLLGDLWTTYLMLLESDGLNEMQLHAAGIGDWVLRVLRECHSQGKDDSEGRVLALAASVACLVLSHNQISSLPVGDRNQVLNLLRPYTTPKALSSNDRGPDELAVGEEISDGADAHLADTSYYSRFTITTPDVLTASVSVTFAFKEVIPLQIPPHLPATRAIATATGRQGPTMDDLEAVARRRTPLVADSFLESECRESEPDLARERQRASRSGKHDEDFYRIARQLDAGSEAWKLVAYIPGLLRGVWEGSYMVAPSSLTSCPSLGTGVGPDDHQDFMCRQPIQFRLEEYMTFSPWQPMPIKAQDGFNGYMVRNLIASEEESTRIQFSDGKTGKSYHYEPFRLSGATESGRNPRHAIDVVITGETPWRYEAAWGSYSYIGRVRLSDGMISLTRKPKGDGDGCGTWVFEGYLRNQRTFVGHWRNVGGVGQEGVRGIFSMSKTAE